MAVVRRSKWQRLRLVNSSLGWRPWLAGTWLCVVGLLALLAPYLPLPYAPALPDLSALSVSPAAGAATGHWLGTDPLGRDILANLVFGCRTALLFSLPAAALAALLGAGLGGAAGFWGNCLRLPLPGWAAGIGLVWWGLGLPYAVLGWAGATMAAALWAFGSRRAPQQLPAWPLPLDGLVLAAAALLGTVPRLLLVIAVAAGGQLSPEQLLGLLVLSSWVGPARLVRAETLRVRVRPFIEAAHVLGLPAGRVWLRHVMPLALRPLRAALPLSLAGLIGLESTLAFLGVGLSPAVASWGRLLSAARLDIGAWWTAAFPMAFLALTVGALRTFVPAAQPSYMMPPAKRR